MYILECIYICSPIRDRLNLEMSLYSIVLQSHTQAPKSLVDRDKAAYPHLAKCRHTQTVVVTYQPYVGRVVPIKAHFFVHCSTRLYDLNSYLLLAIDRSSGRWFVCEPEVAGYRHCVCLKIRHQHRAVDLLYSRAEPKSPFFVPEAATLFRDHQAFQLLRLIEVRKHGGTKSYVAVPACSGDVVNNDQSLQITSIPVPEKFQCGAKETN